MYERPEVKDVKTVLQYLEEGWNLIATAPKGKWISSKSKKLMEMGERRKPRLGRSQIKVKRSIAETPYEQDRRKREAIADAVYESAEDSRRAQAHEA
jgi:hypothetical protein